MSSLAITGIVFACIFGGALLGMLVRARLPEHHLNPETKDVVKLASGITATMTAMVLGLLVASAKSSFDAQRNFVVQLAANVVMLDRTLAHYGKEAHEARTMLREAVADMLQRASAEQPAPIEEADGKVGRYEGLYDKIQELTPTNDAQGSLKSQSLKIVTDTGQARMLLVAQVGTSIPTPFLVHLVAWLALLFASFGLFAPGNGTAVAALLVGALVVSSSLFLILELDHPFSGIIHVSSQPLQNALSQLGR